MGYYAQLENVDVEIIELFQPAALEALKRENAGAEMAWVDREAFARIETLAEALRACRYEVDEDERGSLVVVGFGGSKWGDDERLWLALAPFVRDNGSMDWRGEDGAGWRYLFRNGKLYEQEEIRHWNDPVLLSS